MFILRWGRMIERKKRKSPTNRNETFLQTKGERRKINWKSIDRIINCPIVLFCSVLFCFFQYSSSGFSSYSFIHSFIREMKKPNSKKEKEKKTIFFLSRFCFSKIYSVSGFSFWISREESPMLLEQTFDDIHKKKYHIGKERGKHYHLQKVSIMLFVFCWFLDQKQKPQIQNFVGFDNKVNSWMIHKGKIFLNFRLEISLQKNSLILLVLVLALFLVISISFDGCCGWLFIKPISVKID